MKSTLTNREIFDRVKTHLLTQNQKALAPGGGCSYREVRKELVLKCAVGCLISDEDYNVELEARPCSDGYVIAKLDFELTDIIQQNLLKRLQSIHDNVPVEKWPQVLDVLEKTLDPEPNEADTNQP